MTQVLALIAVRATEPLTARARGLIAQNTALAFAFFARWATLFEWRQPGAGPIAFPRCVFSVCVECVALPKGAGRLSFSGGGREPDPWHCRGATNCMLAALHACMSQHEHKASRLELAIPM